MRTASRFRMMRAAALTALGGACAPASRFHEPQLAPTLAAAPGADTTAAALVGEWSGHFDAPYYARRGTLQMSLKRVARVEAGTVTSTVAGTATIADRSIPIRMTIDSARVGRGRVVLFLEPFADQESGATISLRLDGSLAADTLGGRLRADAAATVPSERHGGWRLTRVVSTAAAAPTASRVP